MATPRPLGEFEQLVLLAILQRQADAHGVGIGRALEDDAGRSVSRGALYTTLDRLESKGLVRWKLAAGGDERARLPRRVYAVTTKGLAAVQGIALDPARVLTNIVIFDVQGTGRTAAEISEQLAAKKVLCSATEKYSVRMVTHCDVDRAGNDIALAAIAQVVAEKAPASAAHSPT